jgi:SAM-dependent methyltransferase
LSADPIYDRTAIDYQARRRADPRIARAILAALGDARAIVNVGAGTGSYEPTDRRIIAVEPSAQMILRRPSIAAPVLRAVADALPFTDGSFDASLAILTVHHWRDRAAGLLELRRVARGRVVILTWDPAAPTEFWLVRDYFPAIRAIDRAIFPALSEFHDAFGSIAIHPVAIPHDCTDGFLGAYWRRPEIYLDERARGAISTFSKIDDVSRGLEVLRQDLADGTWARRNKAIREKTVLDLGYRIVVGG